MTATAPRLALCIPAFNAAEYLPRLFASIRAQSMPFDEVWVYDDCSTDNTYEVARDFGAKIIRGDINRGCSCGKNVLARATKCDWLHFHDADDEMFPCFVERARYWMEMDQYDVILFPYEERDEKTGSFIAIRRFDPDDVMRDPISYSIREQINPFCGLYRRVAFLDAGGYDTDPLVLYNEDVAMHCRIACAGLKFVADNQVLVINNRRFDSMSASSQSKCLVAHYHVMKKTLNGIGCKYYKDIAKRLWVVVGGSAAYLDWETADAAARLARKIDGVGQISNNRIFRIMCMINLKYAIRIREYMIRLFRPILRINYPGMIK